MNCPMAAEAGTTTVVFAENWGALLKYPASLRVNLVEERYGHRNSTCYPVSTKKAKVTIPLKPLSMVQSRCRN